MKTVRINTVFKKFLFTLVHYYLYHGLSTKYFLKSYGDYYMFEKHVNDELSPDESEFFADFLYYRGVDYAVESPSDVEKGHGYMDYNEFREKLLIEMEKYEFVLDDSTRKLYVKPDS